MSQFIKAVLLSGICIMCLFFTQIYSAGILINNQSFDKKLYFKVQGKGACVTPATGLLTSGESFQRNWGLCDIAYVLFTYDKKIADMWNIREFDLKNKADELVEKAQVEEQSEGTISDEYYGPTKPGDTEIKKLPKESKVYLMTFPKDDFKMVYGFHVGSLNPKSDKKNKLDVLYQDSTGKTEQKSLKPQAYSIARKGNAYVEKIGNQEFVFHQAWVSIGAY